MAKTTLEAEARQSGNKNEARRLRRAGRIPAVLYGASKDSIPLTVNPKQVKAVLDSETGHNTILDVTVANGENTSAMIVDWQYEPVRGALLHVDLKRIALDKLLRVTVPAFAVGEPAGVKNQGGILEFVIREIEVECLPADIPEHINIDVTELVIGKNLRVKDLRVDPRVRLISDPEQVVVHVIAPKAEEVVAETAEAAAPAEPEVIKKGKVEKEEEVEPAEGKKKEKETAEKKK